VTAAVHAVSDDAARPIQHLAPGTVVRRRDLRQGLRGLAHVYRAVDQHGQVIDVYVSQRRDIASVCTSFTAALTVHGGSPEQVTEGYKYFGYDPGEGTDHADVAREHARVFLEVIDGQRFAEPNPRPMFPTRPACWVSSPSSATDGPLRGRRRRSGAAANA